MRKNREVILYLLFGGISFFLNIVLFYLLNVRLGLNELLANIICWVVCVLFQFVTNSSLVFRAKAGSAGEYLYQMGTFFAGRVFTLVLEEGILFVFITLLDMNSMVVKVLAQILVIVLNYVISKFIVFKEKGE